MTSHHEVRLIDLGEPEDGLHPEASTPLRRRHGAQERVARTHDSELWGTQDPEKSQPGMGYITADETGPRINRSDPVGQWRPYQEEEQTRINNAMLQSLETLTKHILTLDEQRQTTPDFTFAGADVEDPEVFIKRLNQFFEERRTKLDNRVAIARKVLRGDARKWADSVTAYDIPWQLFITQLIANYNSPIVIGRITRRLYGEVQGPKEDPTAFVTEKYQLFRRLACGTSERQQVITIQELLSPWYRSAVRQAQCETISALMETVAQVGTDLQDQANVPHPAGLRFYRGENTRTTTTNREQTTTQQAGASPRPPNPCRHCGGPHYNNRCPTLREAGNAVTTPMLGPGRYQTGPASTNESTATPAPAPRTPMH